LCLVSLARFRIDVRIFCVDRLIDMFLLFHVQHRFAG
jgi:hypothetical protein